MGEQSKELGEGIASKTAGGVLKNNHGEKL